MIQDRNPPTRNIVIGQKIDPCKVERAKELRKAMTPEERRLWQCLRGNRLDGLHFRRQQVIDGFIVDFYCHAVGVVVEVDGPIHDDQAVYDAARDQVLAARNLAVIRLTNAQVTNDLINALAQIVQVCRERSCGGEQPLPRPFPEAGRGEEASGSPSPLRDRDALRLDVHKDGEEASGSPSPLRGGGWGEG